MSINILRDEPLWYKDAIIYELRVRAFFDHDDDGIGDLQGLTEKLDYIKYLGADTLWLLPFYPSPLKDDGYDISDYMNVHPEVGTLSDFKTFLDEAHARGLRVITELVINHTSDQHPLFQRARRAPPGSPEREHYVWSDTPDRYPEARIIFKDFEHSNWAWDPIARAHYWHRFYSHQPDLNFDNPEVRKFIQRTIDFWLGMGVDGLRLDAVPYLFEREGTNGENLPETHRELKALRAHVDAHFNNRMFLAEANQWPEDAAEYFGTGDECHMAFHFPIMPRLFMSIRMEDRYPLVEIISQTPQIPERCQWALFLRNHDELTLEMVTDEERDYMYRAYAHDPHARINLGIRHRLAPLMRNDRRQMELLNGLLFSLPGTPVLYYGDEIGMGDNIFLGDRNGVRTPMQWSSDRNAGFSRANPQRLYLPVIVDPEYHYETVNVENQRTNPSSLLRWTRRLISMRKRHSAFGRGSIEFLLPENHRVLTFLRQYQEQTILVVANLSRFSQYVELDLSRFAGAVPVELFGKTPFPPITEAPYLLTLSGHAFFWFRIAAPSELHPREMLASPLPLLGARGAWLEALLPSYLRAPSQRGELEALLPSFLETMEWYAGEADQVRSVELLDLVRFGEEPAAAALLFTRLESSDGVKEMLSLPLAFSTGAATEELYQGPREPLLATLRIEESSEPGGAREGLLHGAAADPRFGAALLGALARGETTLPTRGGELFLTRFAPFERLEALARSNAPMSAEVLDQGYGTTIALFGGKARVSLFHTFEEEPHPDLELSIALQERTAFEHLLPVAGSVEYRRQRGQRGALALVRLCEEHRPSAWSTTLTAVRRYLTQVREEGRSLEPDETIPVRAFDVSERETPRLARELMGECLERVGLIAERTARLQLCLASLGDEEPFTPEPFNTLARRSRYQSMRNRIRMVFQQLRQHRREIDPAWLPQLELIIASEDQFLRYCKLFLDANIVSYRIRCHGLWTLHSLLDTGSDFLADSFEGNRADPLSERRRKRSPMRDVVTMVHSLQLVAMAPLFGPSPLPELTEAELVRLKPFAIYWRRWAIAAFLRRYFQVASACSFLPSEREQLRSLFNTYLVEEMVNSVGHMLEHRRDWLKAGLVLLLDARERLENPPSI